MANLQKDFDDWMDRFFNEPVFSIPELFSEKSWYPVNKFDAQLNDGVPRLVLPKVEQATSRKISLKAA